MNRFLIKSLLFLVFGISVLFAVLSAENGNADPFHLKLVGPKQQSLIIGNSKAAQGLIPDVLDRILENNQYPRFFNFSFAVNMSSFGSVYKESIQAKLDPNTDNGLFIIAVDPWSLMGDENDPENEKLFPDWELPLAVVNVNSSKPNISYLINWYPYPNYEILLRRWRPANEILHSNGWLEVRLPMEESDKQGRLVEKLRQFTDLKEKNKFSNLRFRYLSETVQFLKRHGRVFLVRIPSHPIILQLEEEMIPDFNYLMAKLHIYENVNYLDLSVNAKDYDYTDGIHLHQSSSYKISYVVGNWIKRELEKSQN